MGSTTTAKTTTTSTKPKITTPLTTKTTTTQGSVKNWSLDGFKQLPYLDNKGFVFKDLHPKFEWFEQTPEVLHIIAHDDNEYTKFSYWQYFSDITISRLIDFTALRYALDALSEVVPNVWDRMTLEARRFMLNG